MTNKQRFLIGGAGGLAPIIMFLVTVDVNRIFSQPTFALALGYAVRAVLLFCIGGFVAYLQSDETQPFRIFQLGLGAPAMIAGFIATGSTLPSTPQLITAVYAATSTQTGDGVKTFTLPPTGAVGQFVEGLTGARSPNVWFVIVSSSPNVNEAKAAAAKINSSFPGFHADVYAPLQDSTGYSVVIGANLTEDQAKSLQQKAIGAGVGAQTIYKTFSSLPRS